VVKISATVIAAAIATASLSQAAFAQASDPSMTAQPTSVLYLQTDPNINLNSGVNSDDLGSASSVDVSSANTPSDLNVEAKPNKNLNNGVNSSPPADDGQ